MKRFLFCSASVALCFAATAGNASAEILFESGTLGPTGVTWEQVTSDETLGVNVSPAVFGGVRFHLSNPAVTMQVGGHFVARPDADHSFFGAIVQLEGENDFPNSENLSTSDVRGAALLTFPNESAEVFGELNLFLEPNWYALVFGSGLFGATGAGASLRNNTDIASPDYIGFQSGFGWGERASQDGKRFLVLGNIVPESASMIYAMLAVILVLGKRFRRTTTR